MASALKTSLSLALLFAVACGGGNKKADTTPAAQPDPPKGPAVDKPPTVPLTGAPEDLLRLFEGLAGQVKAVGGDCAKYASAVKGWVGTNAARYEELRGKVDGTQLPPDEEQQFQSRLSESLGVIVSGASTCGDNDQAWSAFKSFDSLVEGG